MQEIYHCSLLENVFLIKPSVFDEWTWKVDHSERYPDKGVYHLLMHVKHDEPMPLKNLIRNKVTLSLRGVS